ncbi:MAG TPA: amidohydrolase [Candidatus Baltobacteraceae bacterium]|nr:amidohydrolase [Candidatus Baltobacteraceae bacterium]
MRFPAAASGSDLLVYGATLHTVDPQTPNADAFVVRNGRFAFVGTYAEAKRFAGARAKRLNLHGSTVLPGLIDAHIHLQSVGLDLNEADLRNSLSFDEVVARTAAFARHSSDAWILGDGWDQNRWPGKQFPTHDKLSAAFPDKPVVLGRVDGHALLVNAKAMQLAGITRATADPAGGRILRDERGEPTGVFIDNAMELVARVIPSPTLAQYERATQSASAEAHRFGLTSVADPGCDHDKLQAYEHLAHAGQLKLRTYAMIADDLDLVKSVMALPPIVAAQDGVLWIRSIKLFADGALGSRGAALLEPYSDDPSNTGIMRTTQAHIETVCDLALVNGFQVNTHAIGDRGNRTVLDAYEAALRRHPKNDHRFRIEHAQILSPQDIPRFAKLGVIPSMQTTHQISDMGWAQARLGAERILGGYAWRSLLDTGVIIPNGTDAPVEVVSTLRTFHAAISRENEENQPPGGWYPAQRMTRGEALKSMTIWAAHANFQEGAAGSISRGKYADFVVMDRDWMTAPAESIMDTRIQATYFGGSSVYEAPAQHAALASRRGVRSRLQRPCACG